MMFAKHRVRPRGSVEKRSLDEVLTKIRSVNRFAPSIDLDHFLGRWSKFVEEVERGYALHLADYENDLLIRDDIAEIQHQVPARLAAEIEEFVAPLDFRFRVATRPSRHLLPGDDRQGFWWSRVPRRPEGDLIESLLAEGLLPRE
jgi:hypothetical protein